MVIEVCDIFEYYNDKEKVDKVIFDMNDNNNN